MVDSCLINGSLVVSQWLVDVQLMVYCDELDLIMVGDGDGESS